MAIDNIDTADTIQDSTLRNMIIQPMDKARA